MKKHLACCGDIFSILIDFRRRILPEDHFVETDDRIDRRPDFMTHAGEEGALREIQFADLFLLCLLLNKALLDGVFIIVDYQAEKELNGGEIDKVAEIAPVICCKRSVDIVQTDNEPIRDQRYKNIDPYVYVQSERDTHGYDHKKNGNHSAVV